MSLTPPSHTIELLAGDLRLALRPDLGGSIAGFWRGEDAVLRSTEGDALAGSRTSACYPLVPYSNRIGLRRFRWLGQDYTTAQNFDDNPHSVHGVAWQRPWSVLSQTPGQVEMRLSHEPDAHWPFAFEVVQTVVLAPNGLELRLRFTNRAPIAQPVGLGWHPYFPKRQTSRLQINVAERWDSDASGLPVQCLPQPPIADAVANLNFDNCFNGFVGSALIDDERLAMRLTSSMDRLVVFTPDEKKPYYCVEPVSHVSNAIQMADPLAQGLQSVLPGSSFEGWMRLEARDAVKAAKAAKAAIAAIAAAT